jgi:hypothetical protein
VEASTAVASSLIPWSPAPRWRSRKVRISSRASEQRTFLVARTCQPIPTDRAPHDRGSVSLAFGEALAVVAGTATESVTSNTATRTAVTLGPDLESWQR